MTSGQNFLQSFSNYFGKKLFLKNILEKFFRKPLQEGPTRNLLENIFQRSHYPQRKREIFLERKFALFPAVVSGSIRYHTLERDGNIGYAELNESCRVVGG